MVSTDVSFLHYFVLSGLLQSVPRDMFTMYAKPSDKIKMYVRRVFITDDFEDMMPKYLGFVHGVVSWHEKLPTDVLQSSFCSKRHT